jgi:hypothetical protein
MGKNRQCRARPSCPRLIYNREAAWTRKQFLRREKHMRLFIITALLPLLVTALFAAGGAGGADSSSNAASNFRFPALDALNLDKRPVKLPHDFAGERNLVVIAFQRQQQKDVDTWLDTRKRFETIDPALRYYELPTLARLNVFARWFIDNGMRGGIPSHEQRARTITLYLDKEPFRAALGLGDESSIYVLLLDREGNILWRSQGNFDESKAQSLEQALERLTHAH